LLTLHRDSGKNDSKPFQQGLYDITTTIIIIIMPPPLIGGALSDDAVRHLSDVCLSVAYIGPKSRTERPRKTKIGTVSHVTRILLSRSKVKVTRLLYSLRP